jgi:hypothetical protein
MLGEIVDYKVRLVLVTLFSFIGAFLVFRLEPSTKLSSYFVVVVPIMFFLLALVDMGWMTSFSDNLPLNILVGASMVGGIFLSPKTSITRTYMMLSLAGYLLEL